jgi:CheY-like chemotaxis protein
MKTRIQIIDDNVALTTLLAKALARFGYEPVVENNPLLAVNTVRHYMPDLILLDVMMPERDGGRVLLDLRNDLSLRYIPVILLTAIAREAQGLADTGGIRSQILAKPVQLQELLSTIEAELKGAFVPSPAAPQEIAGGPGRSNGHLAELPDFASSSAWVDSQRGGSLIASPPSSAFSDQFPSREGSVPGPSFSFPPRPDEDSLPS